MPKKWFSKERDEKFKSNHAVLFSEPDEREVEFLEEQEVLREAKRTERKALRLGSLAAERLSAKTTKALQKLKEYGQIIDSEHISKSTLQKFERAVSKGKSKIVENILRKFRYLPLLQAQLLAANKLGLNPLHTAAAKNHAGVVRKIIKATRSDWILLRKLLEPCAVGTPWQLAVKGRSDDVIKEFLDLVGDDIVFFKALIATKKVTSFFNEPSNPMTGLIVQGKVNVITRMLEMAKGDDELLEIFLKPNERGDTVLHIAAAWGHTPLVKVLLAAGVNVRAENSLCQTALDLARQRPTQLGKEEQSRLVEMKKALARIEKAMPNVGSIKEQLRAAMKSSVAANSSRFVDEVKIDKVIEKLLELIPVNGDEGYDEMLQSNKINALQVAICLGERGLAKDVIEAGIDVNLKDVMDDLTMLHIAVAFLNPGIVSDMLAAGANPQTKSRRAEKDALEFLKDVEDSYLNAKASLDKEIEPLEKEAQRLLKHVEVISVLEKAIVSTAMPEEVKVSSCGVNTGGVKLRTQKSGPVKAEYLDL